MKSRRLRASSLLASAIALVFIAAACGSVTATPITIFTTPTPAPTGTPTPTPTPTPTASPTPAPTPTPGPSGSVAPTTTPAATPTPTPGPTIGPGACSADPTKSADGLAFWTTAANRLTFAVYCAVVPSGWWFTASQLNYMQPNAGWVWATYKNAKGAQILIQEGAYCTSDCTPGTYSAAANFSDQAGKLYTLPGGGFAIYVDAGTAHAYTATGTNVTQATFVSFVENNLQKVGQTT